MSRKPPSKTSLSFEVRARLLNRLMGLGPDAPDEPEDENEPSATTANLPPSDLPPQTIEKKDINHLHNDS